MLDRLRRLVRRGGDDEIGGKRRRRRRLLVRRPCGGRLRRRCGRRSCRWRHCRRRGGGRRGRRSGGRGSTGNGGARRSPGDLGPSPLLLVLLEAGVSGLTSGATASAAATSAAAGAIGSRVCETCGLGMLGAPGVSPTTACASATCWATSGIAWSNSWPAEGTRIAWGTAATSAFASPISPATPGANCWTSGGRLGIFGMSGSFGMLGFFSLPSPRFGLGAAAAAAAPVAAAAAAARGSGARVLRRGRGRFGGSRRSGGRRGRLGGSGNRRSRLRSGGLDRGLRRRSCRWSRRLGNRFRRRRGCRGRRGGCSRRLGNRGGRRGRFGNDGFLRRGREGEVHVIFLVSQVERAPGRRGLGRCRSGLLGHGGRGIRSGLLRSVGLRSGGSRRNGLGSGRLLDNRSGRLGV